MNVLRYFILLAYNGSPFHGWQIQPNAISVQEVLNNAISTLLGEKINLVGCGRTDTGVHAKQFVAHFDTEKQNLEADKLTVKLNAFLPKEIVISRIAKVSADAHARFDATERTYTYHIHFGKNPFAFDFHLLIHYSLNVDKMNEAANKLLDYTDFTSFSKKHTDTKSNDCKVTFARWEKDGDKLVFTITANRFLRNMVRSIVGTLLDVGKGKITISEFCKIIEAKNRCKAKVSVAANALFLEQIKYPYSF